jgi:hypothetical protein
MAHSQKTPARCAVAGITIDIAEARLALWLEADAAVSAGQSYAVDIGTSRRSLTRADAAEIRRNIDYWDGWCKRLDPAGRGRGGIPAAGVVLI